MNLLKETASEKVRGHIRSYCNDVERSLSHIQAEPEGEMGIPVMLGLHTERQEIFTAEAAEIAEQSSAIVLHSPRPLPKSDILYNRRLGAIFQETAGKTGSTH
jgi:hypothetical protein